MRLKNKIAIVTGGSRGIGAAIAVGLAREGATVVINFSSSEAEAKKVALEIRDAGGKSTTVKADIGKPAERELLLAECLRTFGRIDILVNNAGIEFREPFLTTTEAQYDQTLDVNLKAAFFLGQQTAKVMVKAGKGGKIVNISSCHDTIPLYLRSAYAVSKGGLGLLTKAMALELAEHKINVNAVSPGAILTDINRESLSDPAARDRLLARIPWKRLGEPRDCVGAVVFLASSEADYVTGTTLYVDGGLLLRKT